MPSLRGSNLPVIRVLAEFHITAMANASVGISEAVRVHLICRATTLKSSAILVLQVLMSSILAILPFQAQSRISALRGRTPD